MGSLSRPMPPLLTVSLRYCLGTTDPFTLVLKYLVYMRRLQPPDPDVVRQLDSDLRGTLFQAGICKPSIRQCN